MFKKLKEKITEEVKSSPQRFQQLTQSVSERLQNSATSDENFFSIAEDDANTSVESPGFTNVSLMSPQEPTNRRNSNSSIASDVSFLPHYESFANMYHLQSDLDISASEVEDNASSSSQLGHLTKEQIYSAFQKSQMRYHKYRGRYTDLARHYKDLERENHKMKSVLVETQDKAIRRVTELKEQCALEQKAKAHLEGALRDELDEKQFKIQSLQTKIELLQNGASQPNDNLETLNKYVNEARQEIESLNEKIQEMKANAIIFQTKEQEYKMKIAGYEKEIALVSEREKENNLTLAQNKMELHNELLSKDNELSNLKQENEALRRNLEVTTSGKLENLQTQNKKLIDKLEVLTQKCNNYENDLLKMEQYRIELQNSNQLNLDLKNQLKDFQDKLEEVRDDAKKSLLNLESKVEEKVRCEFESKEEILKLDFEKKLEEITKNESSLKDVQLALIEKEDEMKKLREINNDLLQELSLKADKYNNLEKNHLELIEDCVQLRSRISTLEKDLAENDNLRQVRELKVSKLEETVANLERQILDYRQIEDEKNELLKLESDQNEETNKISVLLEEERTKCGNYAMENSKLNQELQSLKDSILKREETTKQLELKFDEEKQKLLQKLEVCEDTIKKLEVNLSELSEELNVKRDEVVLLKVDLKESVHEKNKMSEKLAASEEIIKTLQNSVAELNDKAETEKENWLRKFDESQSEVGKVQEFLLNVENLEKQICELNLRLETERQLNSELEVVKIENVELRNNLKALEEEKCCQIQELNEKSTRIDSLEKINSDLTEELISIKNSIKSKDEILKVLEEKLENENKNNFEEINLLKKLLEDANNNLVIKEHDFRNLQELYTNSENDKLKLAANIEKHEEKEQNLVLKLKEEEQELKQKQKQIDLLSLRLEQYGDLIDERNEGFLRIFRNFPTQTNNSKHKNNKISHNLEEKLQIFEKTFSQEKENLSRILEFLKQFEATYTSLVEERTQLESDKEECLKEIANLRAQIQEVSSTGSTVRQLEDEILRVKEENVELSERVKKLSENVLELESRNTQIVSDSNFLSEENQVLVTQIEEIKLRCEDLERKLGASEGVITNLEARLESNLKESQKEVLDLQLEKRHLQEEIASLKLPPSVENESNEDLTREIEALRTKIVQYKSLDLTNRSSIEFYENELQKLKNQNEKLNRKLDETLVTLSHCSELSNSTEIEYLRNVLYNYMLGKESLVLARVIAAVCKFDPHQTETILAKEQQKQTVLGQLGFL